MKSAFASTLMAAAIVAAGTISAAPALAGHERSYDVTITNITRGQVITPPLVVAHGPGFTLFEVGTAASDELATLAETGNPGPLAGVVAGAPGVAAVATGAAPLMPGESVTISINADGGSYLSVAAMLALTNDAFAAVRGVSLPRRGSVMVGADAYDAGSEANNEAADFVPGLGGGLRDTADAEGFIHVHAGIHGGADLVPSIHDWRNPVVEVTIRRVD